MENGGGDDFAIFHFPFFIYHFSPLDPICPLTPKVSERETLFFLIRRLVLILLTALITPLLAMLAATLLFFTLIHRLIHFTRHPVPAVGRPRARRASPILLN